VSSDGNNATLFPGLVADWTTQGTTTAAERPVTVQQPEGKARGAHDLSLPEERYRDIRLLGVGGAGEVRQVLDRTLNRLVAVKTLRSKFAKSDQMMRRFIHEAQIVAQLEHPGIVPVHDLGRLPDGTWFLTMTEIKGQDLDKILRGFHKQRREERGPLTGIYGGWTIRRFIDTLRIICGAVGFAHTKGVIHRDLKPENVMIGDHGEIRVVDWGLAKIIGSEEREEYEAVLAEGGDNWAGDGPAKTRYGVVAGTPAYMPPEQAAGRLDELGPPSDVWALGGMLYSSLYGRLPYRGGARAVIELVQKAPPDVPEIDVPGVLVDIWRKAMSMDPAQRYPDANALGADLEAYIEGSLARERALKLLASARDELREELPRARAKARQQRNLSRQRVQLLRPTDDLGTKEQAWRLEEEAAELQDEVEQHYRSVAARARAALAQVPDLPEARALLADLYRERAEEAEAIGHQENAREYRALLAEVDDGRHADFLRPVGHLHLETEPSGVEVLLYRFVQRARRLHPEALQKLRTPIRELELPEGSYLAVLKAQDHEAVRYPFQVERGGTWSSKEPGEDGRSTVRLPARGSLGGGDRYVAGGWVPIGGDSNARASLGRRRVWVSSFVLRDRPVTHGEYLAFLNDLAGRGHGSTATALCPRIEGRGDEAPRMLYRWESDGWNEEKGRWTLPPGGEADVVLAPDAPVVYVSWYEAVAYCRWYSLRTGQPWRLLSEVEREKAARGADGRSYPWGDFADPAFHCMQDSPLEHPGAPATSDFPVDASPYFAHGLAGGVQEWCADVFQPYGPRIAGSRLVAPLPHTAADLKREGHAQRRAVRGGAWDLDARACRAASRLGLDPDRRSNNLGFRLARST
jgi:serine/threonine protein kinase/formylglycine-generating enzyme required for sulfatase activity